MASFFERVTDLMQKDGGIYMPKEGISELIDIKAEKKKKKGKLAYEDIAEIAGVSLQTIYKWKRGAMPKREPIEKLAIAFGVKEDWLLGKTDAATESYKQGFFAFEEYGFSQKAYHNLLRLKKQGADMNEVMKGLNCLLEYAVFPYELAPEDIEVAQETLEREEDAEEKAFLEARIAEDQEKAKLVTLPVLDLINKFFSLYPEGERVTISGRGLARVRQKVESHGMYAGFWSDLDVKRCRAPESDAVALLELESLFHKCKRELLKRELKGRNLKQEIDDLISEIGEDVSDEECEENAPVPFMSTQEVALDALCDFYDLHDAD